MFTEHALHAKDCSKQSKYTGEQDNSLGPIEPTFLGEDTDNKQMNKWSRWLQSKINFVCKIQMVSIV
jgi:hypothetical protein